MRASYALHAVSWLASASAFAALFYSLTVFGVSVAVAMTAWLTEDIVRRIA
ncbi:hypothetical protein [Mycolicibacterium houstonense]|uniref:hypothetical protein n=1 Tax=Mycolicibacterium houstonense TaxID=146021 RepID=UPI000B12C3FF|nr:hypothetical protein [Mycolicibacterium houstonense]